MVHPVGVVDPGQIRLVQPLRQHLRIYICISWRGPRAANNLLPTQKISIIFPYRNVNNSTFSQVRYLNWIPVPYR
jgi:hypothetical protein